MTENVWDYPRPPRVEPSDEHVTVEFGGIVIVDTTASIRVLETSHPPTYCFVNGERVQPQEGGFYGGWITSRVTGPFKGAPGTRGW